VQQLYPFSPHSSFLRDEHRADEIETMEETRDDLFAFPYPFVSPFDLETFVEIFDSISV